MKWTLLIITGLLGAWAWDTVTVTPNRADFGKAVVQGGGMHRFVVAMGDTMPAIISIEGPDSPEFGTDLTGRGGVDTLFACSDDNALTFIQVDCKLDVFFQPMTLGVKTATLVVVDHHGHRATAALRGEAVRADCLPILVPCNWIVSYSGNIKFNQVDSVINETMKSRTETNVDVQIALGLVQCKGHRNEIEQTSYNGVPEGERKGVFSISGPGMAAIEFQPDEAGKMTYVLTIACPTYEGKRESRSLRGGEVDVLKVKAEPVDWRNSQMVGTPNPATEQGMPSLVGSWTDGEWDPENKAGTRWTASWNLRKPRAP
jgi:hypothetical protein